MQKKQGLMLSHNSVDNIYLSRIDYTSKSLFFNIAVKVNPTWPKSNCNCNNRAIVVIQVGQEGQKCNEVYPRLVEFMFGHFWTKNATR